MVVGAGVGLVAELQGTSVASLEAWQQVGPRRGTYVGR
jgi:hypothetical protein